MGYWQTDIIKTTVSVNCSMTNILHVTVLESQDFGCMSLSKTMPSLLFIATLLLELATMCPAARVKLNLLLVTRK